MDPHDRTMIGMALDSSGKGTQQTVLRLPHTPLSTPIGTPFPDQADQYVFSREMEMWIDDVSDTSSVNTLKDSVLDYDEDHEHFVLPTCPSPPLRASNICGTGEYVLLRTAHALAEAEQLLLSQDHIHDIPRTLDCLSQVIDAYTIWLTRCSENNVTGWLETLAPQMSAPALPKIRVGDFELDQEETQFVLPRLVGFRLRRLKRLVATLERSETEANGENEDGEGA